MRPTFLLAVLVALPLTLAAEPGGAARDITWEELIPPGWVPPPVEIDHFFDAAPPPAASLEETPVVRELDGQRVRLPGYLVPLDVQDERVKTFLMVPYFGACIHVPPPPPNQVVFVQLTEPVELDDPYGAHWVTGQLSTSAATSSLADASYSMRGERVETLDWEALHKAQEARRRARAVPAAPSGGPGVP
jgi:hypothetical protein